ncbi:MAG: UDP-glucose 4-epimerase GalE [Planctomycetota bacterium]|jgi:UDP-glucose 4-epimerase
MGDGRILVAGGAGYIGSCTARMIAGEDRPVVVFDDLSSGHEEAVPGIPFHRGDLLDRSGLERVFHDHPDIRAVMLFAGRISVPESVARPEMYYRVNLGGALALLDVMVQRGVERIVFSSSAAVYGEPDETPIPESAPRAPVNPYGRIKVQIEEALQDLADAGRLRFASLRYFNAAGAEPDASHGEDHDPETHLIPLAVRAGLEGGPPLKVFGTDYPTSDGTCVRDFVHVRDLARAHLLALDRLDEGAPGRVYNLGSGRGFSVRPVIDAVSAALDAEVPVETASRRRGDPPSLVAGAAKIERELGWVPEFDLRAIVESAAGWHRARPRGYSKPTP